MNRFDPVHARAEQEKQDSSPWRWCLVGNIAEYHAHGEDCEVRSGTKQFAPGAKLYLAPVQWGDGYENIVGIGKPRHRRGLIEIVMPRKYITDFRLQKVFRPSVLERMEKSAYLWWGDTDADRERILALIDSLNAAAAEKAKAGERKADAHLRDTPDPH